MTKFADQLFDDLIREHGSALAGARPPAPRRHAMTGRAVLAVGGGGVAVAAAAAVLAATAGGGAPRHGVAVAAAKTAGYAVTANPDGTVTLAVYRKSGIAGANAKLRELGDRQVYVVPVAAGCPSVSQLPPPAVRPAGRLEVTTGVSADGAVTVNAKGIPAGDILVVGVEVTATGNGQSSLEGGKLTSAPAPDCLSLPAPPIPPGPPAGSGNG